MLNGYDYDHVITAGIVPEPPYVIVSGRLLDEYCDDLRWRAYTVPVYIRGTGERADHADAGLFKAFMIASLGITRFYEDNAEEVGIISRLCPDCFVVHVT